MGLITDIPIIYIFLCFFLGFLYAYILYRKEKLILKTFLLRLLFFLRFLFVTLVAFLLLNPTIKSIEKEFEDPIVIIAQDASASIQDSVLEVLKNINTKLSDFDVHNFSFSDDVNVGFSNYSDGLKTDINNLFVDINSRFANQNIAALILASDGLYNKGSNPIYNKNIQYPVYSVLLGDTSIKPDVKIINVNHNPIAFLGNTFPLEISLDMKKVKGKSVNLNISNNDKLLYSENIKIDTQNEYQNKRILLEANSVGIQKYNIEASVVFGEENIENNSYVVYVEVIDSRSKILILHAVSHPDIAAYKSVIDKKKNYEVDQYFIDDFDGNLQKYQLVVLFGVQKNSTIINDLKQSKMPLLIFELNKSNLREQLNSGVRFSAKGGLEEVQAIKNPSFSKFKFSEELLNLIDISPPLYSYFGIYNYTYSSECVLQQKIGAVVSDNPIILLSEQYGEKRMFIMAEGFWKWKMFDYMNNDNNQSFDELFSKLTQYLILNEEKTRFRVEYQKYYTEDEDIVFDALFFNESFELVNEKDITISIVKEDKSEYNFEFSRRDDHYFLNIGQLPEGSYSFFAYVKGDNLSKKGFFDVRKIQLEKVTTVADHNMLINLSNNTNGKTFYLDSINDLLDYILPLQNQKIIHTKEKLQGIVNISWILVSLLFLILMELFLRRFNSLI